jgi:hypothetical protein
LTDDDDMGTLRLEQMEGRMKERRRRRRKKKQARCLDERNEKKRMENEWKRSNSNVQC